MVSHAQLPHLLDVVKISAIDDDRLLESALHPLKIGVAVLVPVSDHYQGIRTGERLIVSLSIIYSVAEQSPRVIQSRRVVGADRDALVEERGSTWAQAHWAQILGEARIAAGDVEGGRAALEQAFELFDAKQVVPLAAEVRRRLDELAN